jgi:transcription initiation factor TFIIIB Brf1 subunit/transcription initiation factor TFIIB
MSKKICKLVKKKLPKEDREKYIKIIKKARYFCENCGLVSNKKCFLCKPDKIQTSEE